MKARLIVAPLAAGLVVAALTGPANGTAVPIRRVKVADLPGGFAEPRIAVAPDGRRWLATTDPATGTAGVWSSRDAGRTWRRTKAPLPGQTSVSGDVELVVTHTGRVIVSELDSRGGFVTGFTDDGGETWTASTGTGIPDADRPWLAVGPDDSATHQPRVYLLMHNLFSGAAHHEMAVLTSTDGGASFGPPVPIAPPGTQAFLDLQCADSGAPSALLADPVTGGLLAVFGTRTSAAGGCGASLTGTFEINVVGETRIWVARSPDGSLGSWTDTLAYDGGTHTVSSSFETAALDRAGTAYVTFAETALPYPSFARASVRLVSSRRGSGSWTPARTIVPGGAVGTYDPTVVAGAPGTVAIAYFAGHPAGSGAPRWDLELASVTAADASQPRVSTTVLDPRPAYRRSADQMGGSCASGPLVGVQNGFVCHRAPDNFGAALTRACTLTVTYPMSSEAGVGSAAGTWVLNRPGQRYC
ncbi:MAG: glycoside hydrolase [Actinomycetota bacterium]|nr:glycoside hydrolase [Actinomycetota bacterium]